MTVHLHSPIYPLFTRNQSDTQWPRIECDIDWTWRIRPGDAAHMPVSRHTRVMHVVTDLVSAQLAFLPTAAPHSGTHMFLFSPSGRDAFVEGCLCQLFLFWATDLLYFCGGGPRTIQGTVLRVNIYTCWHNE